MQQWAKLANGRPAAPAWLPTTAALALWRAGRKQEAVEVVRRRRAYLAGLLEQPRPLRRPAPDWREAERASRAEVFAAWQANPLAFP
ncbi:Hypothetical Protein PD5205_03841 [Xanthomonas fragariae]|uniref:Uncharacterized protein n=1 Tax=Xanthomonas fragariae TaxID=48664 RepID=A0A1Y6GUB3_9XANT|nr:hypothetical protein O1K_11012 [Xanthomonas fragariae LMG 25863]SMQ93510.1 Hypothetical Protein NBC2815_00146 [Xanthomonas fragariae]SMQ97427.1 hypothetical protein PD885_00155 [Xanthomonas fragariae]SMR05113.1 Hypothetical Protein PD5205_03841 [Xanthomonas fragariae]